MLTILLLIPWVLTFAALLFIIVRKNEIDDEEYLDDPEYEIIRVAVHGDKAYWVHDNIFYESEVLKEPDFETAKPVDTMSMRQKDLERLFNILDGIEENKRG